MKKVNGVLYKVRTDRSPIPGQLCSNGYTNAQYSVPPNEATVKHLYEMGFRLVIVAVLTDDFNHGRAIDITSGTVIMYNAPDKIKLLEQPTKFKGLILAPGEIPRNLLDYIVDNDMQNSDKVQVTLKSTPTAIIIKPTYSPT